MSTKFEVEKFTGSNDFGLWKMKMKMKAVLVKEGLATALEGEDKLPASMDAAEKKILLEKAYSSLILGLGDKVLREVKKEKSAAGIWTKLESLYMSKAVPNRIHLKQQFFGFTMDERKSIADNMYDFKKLIQDLESLSIEIEDEDQALILLNSLPKSYANFVDTLKYGRQALKLEEIEVAINSKDVENRISGKSDADGLMVRGRPDKRQWKKNNTGNNRSRSKSKPRHIKCYHCHKEGHIRRDCPERKNKKRQEQEFENGDDDVATEGYEMTGSAAVSSPMIDDKTSLWHRRLAHVSEKGLMELSKQGLLCGDKLDKLSFCEHCVYGKMSIVKFNVGKHCTKGVVRHKTVRKTPQQNGLAERMNKTILKRVRRSSSTEVGKFGIEVELSNNLERPALEPLINQELVTNLEPPMLFKLQRKSLKNHVTLEM
ncbi:hypothetical protein EZV62_002630 [Acer yangbiense]|uniref:CCHC-type domain-containing protein n=1 Tax=Acer yangbiense TaxID=1000413 RepID=A0A5C7IXP1_9ROSI|nr:hypothetical protein EZV62_002630 [Acer yangbiense]